MLAKAGLWAPILSLFGPNSRNIRPNYLLIQRFSRAQHRSKDVVLGSWTNISGRTLAAVPANSSAYRLLERRGLLAKRLLELGVIHHEGFLELVKHLDHLAHARVEKTHSPKHDLRCRLDARRLADLLEDHLHEPACRERLGTGKVPYLPQSLLAFAQDNQPSADVGHVGVGVWLVGVTG